MRVENKQKTLYQELALTAIEKSGFNWFKMLIFFFLKKILYLELIVWLAF